MTSRTEAEAPPIFFSLCDDEPEDVGILDLAAVFAAAVVLYVVIVPSEAVVRLTRRVAGALRR